MYICATKGALSRPLNLMRPKFFSVRRSVAPIAGVLALITNAHATYTVIDDDLYPTAAIEARDNRYYASSENLPSDKFKVGFIKGSSTVGPLARSFVDGLLPRMQSAARIRIVARTDSVAPTDSAKQESLAMARAIALRSYIARAGIPSSIVQIEVDTTGTPQAATGISPADIFISSGVAAAPRPQVRFSHEPPAIAHAYRYLHEGSEPARPAMVTLTTVAPRQVQVNASAATPMSAPSNSPANSDERLIAYINQAVQSGQMQPSVALQLLRSMADAAPRTATAQAVSTAPQTIAAPASAPALPVAPAPMRWDLDPRLTLRGNVDAWSKAAGWRPTIWEAANFYQVTSAATLEGLFPEVLRRVADSTGLNICAIPREKAVRVTDANTPCKK